MGDAAAAVAAASPASATRKRRRDDDAAGLRRVAEIVMVLAAAGEVRGGREPTPAERVLAAEARERLAAAVAEGAVRPKDLFPGEAVRAVVEDLGLNRAKDPAAMGFRPPKASIADRLMLTKRKMEEVKEAPVQQTVSTPQTAVSSGMSEFHGLNGATKFGVGVPRNSPVAALAATTPVTSTPPVIKASGSSPVKPVANSSVVLPHSGPSHLKLDKDVNGPVNLARSGAATVVHTNKSTLDTSARSNVNSVQSSNQAVKIQDSKPVAVQAATGSTVMGHRAAPVVAFVPPKPTFVNHNEIAKAVQQFLHQPTNHPSWIPPSTEYMHSRLGCQICKVVISDTDSLLVCDACERGVHLKCLQQYGNKGVPKAEWHCSSCLTQSKGKPLPPKYGKVTRTVVASKAAPPGGGAQAQLSSQGSTESMSAKDNHQKLAANGNLMKPISTQGGSAVHNSNVLALSAITASSQSQPVSTSRPSSIEAVKAETSSNGKEGTEQQCSSTIQPDVKSSLNKSFRTGSSLNTVGSANDTMNVKQTAEISCVKAKIKSEANSELIDCSGTSVEQTKIVATEEKPRSQAISGTDIRKDGESTTNTGTSTGQGNRIATEERLLNEATSEAHTTNGVEMTSNIGIPVQQGSIVNIEEKLQIDAPSYPHKIQDMELGTNNEPPTDQSSHLVDEEKPQSEQTSSTGDVDVTANAGTGIPTDQAQHSNGSTKKLVKEPHGEPDEDTPNAVSDYVSSQKITSNGILYPKDETSCVHENEAVGCNTEAS